MPGLASCAEHSPGAFSWLVAIFGGLRRGGTVSPMDRELSGDGGLLIPYNKALLLHTSPGRREVGRMGYKEHVGFFPLPQTQQ